MTERGAVWTLMALVAAAALAIYAPTYLGGGYGFVNYDDPYLLGPGNPVIGKGLAAGLPELVSPARTPQFMNAWLPLYYTSLGIDHALGGGAPWPFHLHSALLHAAGAALVVQMARGLGLRVLGAGVAGLVFALHPAATENVAWVAGRKDVLSFVWMALATVAYLRGVAGGRAAWHAVGALCLAVSMTAKGTTLVLPGLLALHALFLRRDGATPARRLSAVVPYAVVAASLTALHLWVAAREGTAQAGGAPLGRVLVANLEVAGRYAFLLFVPLRQSVEHGVDAGAVDVLRAGVGAAVLVAWGGLLALSRGRPGRVAFLLAIPVALAPFNNLFPRTSVLFAERYAHAALLPVAIGAGVLATREGLSRWIGLAAAVAAAAITSLRLPVWSDAVALWDDAVAKAPGSALVRMQLADAHAARARDDAAAGAPEAADAARLRCESAWRDAASLARDELSRYRAEKGLATHLLTTAPPAGQTEERVREAAALFDAAERRLRGIRAPGSRTAEVAELLSNRAAARETLGDRDGAAEDWRAAAKADPTSVPALHGLARILLAAGAEAEAKDVLARAADVAPTAPDAVRERARLRIAAGDVAGAKADLERATQAHPGHYDLLIDAARLDASILRPLDAEKLFRRALAARPGDAVARAGVAASLLDQAQAQAARDDLEAARTAARAAAEMLPESSAPHQVLGIVARREKRYEEATQHLRRARTLQPDGPRILEALASVLVERALAEMDAHGSATATAVLLLEDAVAVGAPAIATRHARLDAGTSGWPAPPPPDDRVAAVGRESALVALAHLAAGRPAKALAELGVAEQVTRSSAPDLRPVTLRLLVRASFLTGRDDAALTAAEELAALPAPGDPAWRANSDLATSYVEGGIAARGRADTALGEARFARAHALLDVAATQGMPPARVRLRRGEIEFAQERFLDATRSFDAAIELDPRDPDPLLDRAALWRAHHLLEEDRSFLDAAERDLRRALQASPGDARAMAALGENLVMGARPSEAYPWLQRALLVDPSQLGARRLLAELTVRAARSHLEKKELAEARAAADRALALEAPIPEPLVLHGDVLRAENAPARAQAAYEEAAAAHPDRVEPRAALARLHYDTAHGHLLFGRRREAAEAFRRALDVPQDQFDVGAARERLVGIAQGAFQEGVDLRRARKPASAVEAFTTSILADPTREGWLQIGLCLTEIGDLDGALKAYDASLGIDPKWVSARINRAAVCLRLGDLRAAEDAYRELLEEEGLSESERGGIRQQLERIEAQSRAAEDAER